jgi:N-acyl-D-amino-acid deacylase
LIDLLLHGGTVVDGTGGPAFRADVGVSGGHIGFIGLANTPPARRTLDVTGQVIAPGFIDSHAHDDWAVLARPEMRPKVSQGVTTVINGNCGNSLAPYPPGGAPPLPLRAVEPQYRFAAFPGYLDHLEAAASSVNVASLIGHTALRVLHVEDLARPALAHEIAAMRSATRDALAAGALGLSTGTFYPPAAAATAQEIVGVGADLAEWGGVYATHMRDEGDDVLQSIDEASRIAGQLGVSLVISHHKVVGARNFGRTADTLRKIGLLRETQAVCMDCYPYTASSSLLRLERLALCQDVIVTSSRAMPEVAGRSIDQLAAQWACSREEAMRRVMPGTGMYFLMDEGDVARVLAHPATMVGSDGIPADAYPHPRLWGTFARVLGRYCREQQLFSLEAAVHKMTGMTAAAFGLAGRGRVQDGYAADLVVFDPGRVIDIATYDKPEQASEGISLVFVNGQCVWRDGEHTGARPGRLLRRTHP